MFFLQTISHNQHGKKPCCVVLANIFAIREYLSSLTILNEIFVPYVVDLRKINIILSLFFLKSTDVAGFSALHYAAWYGREKIVQFLVSFDIDPNQPGTVGDRPFHIGR